VKDKLTKRAYIDLGPEAIRMEGEEGEEGEEHPVLSGYAARFNEEITLYPGYREVLMPGCFAEALGKRDVRLLYQHDSRAVAARMGNDTLTLEEDDDGLRFEAQPNMDTSAGSDMVGAIKRGDVDKMSVGFQLRQGDYKVEEKDDGTILYVIERADLWEVSPVTWAAYDGTSVGADGRSIDIRSADIPPYDLIRADAQDHATRNARERMEERLKAAEQYNEKYRVGQW